MKRRGTCESRLTDRNTARTAQRLRIDSIAAGDGEEETKD
jgi:hypothetical protein